MKQKFEEILLEKNIKVTANRLLVLEVLFHNNYSMSLADIQEKIPWADKSAVFRTLKTFEKQALIHAIDDGNKATKYALCSGKCDINHHSVHPHFHCVKCNKTICLSPQDLPLPVLPQNFTIQSYALMINGICSECRT